MQFKLNHRVFPLLAALLVLLFVSAGGLCGLSTPASAQNFGNGLVDASTVTFVNRSGHPLYVGFSVQPGRPGPINWSPDCVKLNDQFSQQMRLQLKDQMRLAPGQVCTASVPSSAGPSRFCATENPQPPGKTLNCFAAQRSNLTMIEANFASGTGCYQGPTDTDPILQKSCVWYDISVAPEGCTNCDWTANNCSKASGPSYNVPVQLACSGAATFTCRGPVTSTGTGAKYPSNCGTPFSQPSCVGGLNAACLQAYFYPMSTSGACKYPASKPQPIAQCREGETLFVVFLDGL